MNTNVKTWEEVVALRESLKEKFKNTPSEGEYFKFYAEKLPDGSYSVTYSTE